MNDAEVFVDKRDEEEGKSGLFLSVKGNAHVIAEAIIARDQQLDIRELDLHFQSDDLVDFAFLREMNSLEEVSLSCCSLQQLSSLLLNLRQLEELYIFNCQDLEDLQFLSAVTTKLKFVQIVRCGSLKDIDGIRHLSGIKELCIHGCDNVCSISAISQLHGLERLMLWLNKVEDFSPIGALRNLTALNLSTCPQLNDISFFDKMPNLNYVILYNCRQLSIFQLAHAKCVHPGCYFCWPYRKNGWYELMLDALSFVLQMFVRPVTNQETPAS